MDVPQFAAKEKSLMLTRQLMPFFLAILAITIFSAVWAERGTYVATVCLLALVSSIVIAICWLSQEDLFNPLAGIWISLFLGTGLRAAYLALSPSDRVQSMMWQLNFEDLAVGANIATLASIAITAGYMLASRVSSPVGRRYVAALDYKRLIFVSIVIALVALFVANDFFRATGFDMSIGLSTKRRVTTDGDSVQSFAALGYHRWAACILPCVLFYFWLWEFFRSRSFVALAWAAAFFLLASGFAFLSSSRSIICIMLLNALYIAHSFRILRFSHVIGVGVCVIAVLCGMLALRQMSTRRTSQINAAETFAPSAAVDAILGNENFADLGRLSLIYRSVPDLLNYKYGMSYITWVFAPIPRTKWREKPVLSQGLEITEVMHGGRRSAKGIEGGGRPPCFIGEVIMNFGLWGVPICGTLYGFALRLFQNFHSTDSRSNVLLSVFILFPASFGLMGGEFSNTVIEILQGLVPTICLLLFSARIYHVQQL